MAKPEGSRVWGPKCITLCKAKQSGTCNEHYYKAPDKFPCCEVLGRPSDSPDPSTKLGSEVEIRPIVVGVKDVQRAATMC